LSHLKAQDYADYDAITAGISDWRNGFNAQFALQNPEPRMSPSGLGCFKTFCHERSELGEVAA
jgi:hypothetical protein